MFGIHRNFPAGSGSTADATASQWHIANGKTAYIASGKVTGNGYFPGAMDFSGGGYYTGTYTSSGNKFTFVAAFKRAAFTGDTLERLCRTLNSGGTQRGMLTIASSDHATTTRRNKLNFTASNSAATTICDLYSDIEVVDDEWHTVFAEFDGDAGTARLEIDGADADDVSNAGRVAPTTGTLASGASSQFRVASLTGGANAYGGQLRYCGTRDAGGLTVSDFTQTDGTPKPLDVSTWAEWGSTQPAFFHEAGKMDENLGSAGAMTANGTITLASAST